MQGGGGITDGDSVAKVGTPTTTYAADTVDNRNVFYLDDGSGSGEQYLPRFTIFSGNTYRFNNNSLSSSSLFELLLLTSSSFINLSNLSFINFILFITLTPEINLIVNKLNVSSLIN